MKREFKINGTIWHGSRYWVSLGEQGFVGWNTRFLPYRIVKLTKARITCQPMVDGPGLPITLNRQIMERDGKQYHTRYHEYFYAVKPDRGPERRYSLSTEAASVLDLPVPYTEADVTRAYKRLARTAHPDAGGSDAAFIALKQARDTAMRSTTRADGQKPNSPRESTV